jgi:hypothetical protein
LTPYILFLFGNFNDFEDIEFYCLQVLGQSEKIDEIKYIIQNLQNIIVIFDSSVDKSTLIIELTDLLNNENVHYYFVVEQKNVFMVSLPDNMSDLIFKPQKKIPNEPKQISNNLNQKLDLNSILEKIHKYGVDSISLAEKKFLDNYKF